MKNVMTLFLIVAACALAGVRIHPANAAKYFEAVAAKNDGYVLLELARGGRIAGRRIGGDAPIPSSAPLSDAAGRHIGETLGPIRIQIGGGTTSFQQTEVKSMRTLSAEEVRSGQYDALIIREPASARPLVTLRYEDSVLAPLERKAGHALHGLTALLREKAASLNPAAQIQKAVTQAASLPEGLPAVLQKVGADAQAQGLLGNGNTAVAPDYTALTQALGQLKKSEK